jgi:hypothetical protein
MKAFCRRPFSDILVGNSDPTRRSNVSIRTLQPFTCDMQTISAMRCGIIHTGLLGDVSIAPALGDMYSGVIEVGTRPVRSCGIMETTVTGDVPVTPARDFGEIPISPARSCGDIYATGAVGRPGDTQTIPRIGDIHAGVWAGHMAAGPSAAFGHMKTT